MTKLGGRHLVVDAFGVESEKLKNKKLIGKMLETIPKKLSMRILRRPVVSEIKSEKYPNVGFSGFVILYESHVSFHTWPEENYAAIDVYSCRDFNEKTAIQYIKESLNPKKLKIKSIKRG